MSAARVVAEVLAGAGALVCVASSLAALLPRGRGAALVRLHFVTPVTSLGTPLIGLGLAVATGWHLASAIILVTVLLVAATGPVLAAATGRVEAQRRNLVAPESPE